MSARMFRCAPLCIENALGIFGPLENWLQQQEVGHSVAFWDPPSGSKNTLVKYYFINNELHLVKAGNLCNYSLSDFCNYVYLGIIITANVSCVLPLI